MQSIEQIQNRWASALISKKTDLQAQTLLGGANYRINVAKALTAAYETANLYIDGEIMLSSDSMGPVEMMNLAKGIWDVIQATLDTIREPMNPLSYTICTVLAASGTDGISEELLKDTVREFLENAAHSELPWYLGFSADFITMARSDIDDPEGFDAALDDCRNSGFLKKEGNKLSFINRDFEWGWRTV